jgi:hypothetical protein
MDLKRKLLLIFPFLMGVFTMICAILSKHLSFTQPFSAMWVFWYCRESSTAVIVTNMPYSWPIIQKAFGLKSFFGDADDTINPNSTIHNPSVDIRAASVSRPLGSNPTTVALDRLYPVDDTALEQIEEREQRRSHAGINMV